MSSPADFERRLADWLDDQAPMREPDGLTYAVLARTRRTRRVPRWASPERWHPLTDITRPALAPPLRIAWLLILAVLVASLAGGVAIVGSRVLMAPIQQAFMPAVASIPQGGAAVLAFDSDGDIFTVRADGTDLRQLTSGTAVDQDPSWSPDGTRLVYSTWAAGTESLVVLDGSGDRTLVTTDEPNENCLVGWQAAWSPDGTMLVVPTSEGCDSRYDLVIVAADGSSPATRLVAPGIESIAASWSPDGSQIAFQGRDEATGATGVYVIDLGEGDALQGGFQARRIGDGPGPSLADAYSVPRWSPDGTELAVVAGTDDACAGENPEQTWDVIVVKADGSGQRALAAGPLDEYNPTWSPDGTRLAFHRTVEPSEYWNDRPCTVRTWIVGANGSGEYPLDDLENNWPPPLWSPDGTRLVGGLIDPPAAPGETNPFHLTIFTVDGSAAPVTLGHAGLASWQPVAAPLPPTLTSPSPSAVPSTTPATEEPVPDAREGVPTLGRDIPDGAASGVVDTPIGPARWVQVTGGASRLPEEVRASGGRFADVDRSRRWTSDDGMHWTAEQVRVPPEMASGSWWDWATEREWWSDNDSGPDAKRLWHLSVRAASSSMRSMWRSFCRGDQSLGRPGAVGLDPDRREAVVPVAEGELAHVAGR